MQPIAAAGIWSLTRKESISSQDVSKYTVNQRHQEEMDAYNAGAIAVVVRVLQADKNLLERAVLVHLQAASCQVITL